MSRIRSSGCGGALVGRAHQQGRLAEKMARLHYFSKPSRSLLTCWCKSGGAPDTTRTVFPVVSNRNIVGTAVISPNACPVGVSAMAQCSPEWSPLAASRTLSSGDSTANARIAILPPWRNSPNHGSGRGRVACQC